MIGDTGHLYYIIQNKIELENGIYVTFSFIFNSLGDVQDFIYAEETEKLSWDGNIW